MSIEELPKAYEPHEAAKWSKAWDDEQLFKADPKADGEPYSIMKSRRLILRAPSIWGMH